MGIECPQLRQQTTPSGARFPQFGHRLLPTQTPPVAAIRSEVVNDLTVSPPSDRSEIVQ
jgi:hypothetical protein